MKTNLNIATSNGYIFINGKLMAYEFISALLDFENGIVKYDCKLGGKKTTLELDECPIVYDNVDGYKARKGDKGMEVTWERALCRNFINAQTSGKDTSECNLWSVVDNKPTSIPAPKSNFLFKSQWNIKYVGDGKYYDTYEHALLYCDLIKVDVNGVETKEASPASKLLLNEEQTVAVEEVKKALKKAESLGVEFLFDRECCDFYVFSKNNIERYIIDCHYGNEGKVDYTDLLQDIDITIGDTNTCDCGLYIEWKK